MGSLSYYRSKWSEEQVEELAKQKIAGELSNRDLIAMGTEQLMHLVWRKQNVMEQKQNVRTLSGWGTCREWHPLPHPGPNGMQDCT